MSASSRPTRAPGPARARARLAATVDLPTPPLPLATAMTDRMCGSAIFCCGIPPWGCMGFSGERVGRSGRGAGAALTGQALGALAQGAEVLQGVDAGVVPVAPDHLVGVAADRRHADRPGRLEFAGLEDAERVGRLLALLA